MCPSSEASHTHLVYCDDQQLLFAEPCSSLQDIGVKMNCRAPGRGLQSLQLDRVGGPAVRRPGTAGMLPCGCCCPWPCCPCWPCICICICCCCCCATCIDHYPITPRHVSTFCALPVTRHSIAGTCTRKCNDGMMVGSLYAPKGREHGPRDCSVCWRHFPDLPAAAWAAHGAQRCCACSAAGAVMFLPW